MTSASFFPSPIRCCGQTLRTASLCVSRSDLHGNWDKEPLIVSSKFPFAYVHHCPGQRVFELDSLALWAAQPLIFCSILLSHCRSQFSHHWLRGRPFVAASMGGSGHRLTLGMQLGTSDERRCFADIHATTAKNSIQN